MAPSAPQVLHAIPTIVRSLRRVAGLCVIAASVCSASLARADDPPPAPPAPAAPLAPKATTAAAPASKHRLVWKDEWPRFRVIEYGVTATLLIELALIEFRAKQPTEANWKGPILFDEEVRDAIRVTGRERRKTISDVSDVFPLALQVQALVLDGLIVPIFTDRWNLDVAWQMTMTNLMAMGAVGVFNRTGHRFVARERPDSAECRKQHNYREDCRGPGGAFASFPGGHASGAFLGAGMICAHHLHLPLYGGGAPDIFACALPILASGATGVMRLMADRHYYSDVIVGSTAGFLGGFALPTLLHYGYPIRHDRKAKPSFGLVPATSPEQLGASVLGSF